MSLNPFCTALKSKQVKKKLITDFLSPNTFTLFNVSSKIKALRFIFIPSLSHRVPSYLDAEFSLRIFDLHLEIIKFTVTNRFP